MEGKPEGKVSLGVLEAELVGRAVLGALDSEAATDCKAVVVEVQNEQRGWENNKVEKTQSREHL